MRHALATLNADLVKDHPDNVCRVTADEGDIGSAHRARFQDVETRTPTVLTTSQLLTTGVDAPTCKNVVLVRLVGSMPEFKQIIGRGTRLLIGRGTRLRPDYGKLAFNIIDYTGTATEKFADPDFDGAPVLEREEAIDAEGETIGEPMTKEAEPGPGDEPEIRPAACPEVRDDPDGWPRKYYVDGGVVEIVRHLVYETDARGKRLPLRTSPTTPATMCAPSIRIPPGSARTGSTRSAGRRSRSVWRNGESTSAPWPRTLASPRRILLTCYAISPIARRSGPVVNGPIA